MHQPFTLKPISHQGLQRAREKAFRYRLLNEPRQAESICRDILAAEPDDQDALRVLLLSITDQFAGLGKARTADALHVLAELKSEYDRTYYHGVILERQAKAQFARGLAGARVYELLRDAMAHYEKAEAIRPEGNDDAILRWNTCARLIDGEERIRPESERKEHAGLIDEDVPMR